MTKLQHTFYANQHVGDDFDPTKADYVPPPPGDYIMQILEADIVASKTGRGKHVRVVLQNLGDKPFKVFDNIVVKHDNEYATKKGQRWLAYLCKMAGILELEDTDQLINTTLHVSIEVENNQAKVVKYNKYVEPKRKRQTKSTQTQTETGDDIDDDTPF